MYRLYRGLDYYPFTYGGVHFVVLNTLTPDDSAYYGRVGSVQLAWLRRDLATVAPSMPVVTFNHIPMGSAWKMLAGFADLPMVASFRMDNGRSTDRHTVANVEGVLKQIQQAAAVVGPDDADGVIAPSGITYYTGRDGVIDAGRFVRL